MYPKKILTVILVVLISALSANAQYPVQIGTPESGGVILPYDNQSDYNWCTTIYPQNKINAWGDIVKVTYDVGSIDLYFDVAQNQKIFMALTSDVAFTDAGYPDTSTMTKVFDGDIVYENSGINGSTEITLTTPFFYNNSENLIIHYENHDGIKVTTLQEAKINFSDNSSPLNLCKFHAQDGSFPVTSGTLTNEMPIVYLGFDSGLDAGISQINNNKDHLLPGNHDLAVNFRNFSGDTITSVDIEWELNGVPQSTINWTGTVYTGQESATINLLGNHDFAPGSYTFRAWTQNPNGGTDLDNTNDLVSLPVAVATYIEIGDFSGNSYTELPYRTYNNFGWSSSIYNSDSIQTGKICGIAYNNNSQGYFRENQKIYLSQSTETIFSSAELPSAGSMSLVFNGSIDYSGTTGWKKILFDSSYLHSNNSNLVVHYQNHSNRFDSPNTQFAVSSYGSQLSIVNGDNTSFPNWAGSFRSWAPNVRLFFALPNDAGITSINEPNNSFNTGVTDLKASLKNFGTDVLNNVDIKYQIDHGTIETFSWSGNLSSYESISHVTIGTSDFSDGEHLIKVWTDNPNGFNDYNSENDTTLATVFAGSPLNGSYVIGSAPSDFTTLKEAIDSLNSPSGISGSVIFDMKPGTYNSQNSLSEIYGVNDLYTITFRSQTGDSTDVVITADSTDFTFRLFGADNIIFQNLTFTTDTASATIVDLQNRSNNILFDGCIFSGNSGIGTLLVTANNESYAHNRLSLNNNLFLSAAVAVNVNDQGVVIFNNNFNGQSNFGIQYTSYDSLLIHNNTFTSGKWAIYGNGKYVTISGNLIIDDVQGAFRLMGADYVVKNNMAMVHGNTSLLTAVYLNLITSKIYNNTLLKHEENAFGVTTILGDNCDFKNNIFINYNQKEIFTLQWGADGNTFDHNVYFTHGSVLGFKNGQPYPTLSDWQLGTSQDLNSMFESVNFISDTDLHTSSLVIDGSGTPVPEVTTDFDNEIRDAAHPDIGADEFSSVCSSPLSGTYTLGETGTYKSFAEALDALKFCGMGGNVTFDIEEGTYNTQILIDFDIPGQNSHTVVFRSAGGDSTKVVVEYNAGSATNYTVKLEGADHISFNNMTLKSLHSEYGRVIELVNQADHNTFSHTIIEGTESDSNLKEMALIYVNELETANDSNVFDNNLINYGSYGVYIDSKNYKNASTFSNNIFTDQGAGAIYCNNGGYVDIISNTINRSSHSNSYSGVYSNYSDSCAIIRNIISIVSDTTANGLVLIGKNTVINNLIGLNTSGKYRITGIFCSNHAWIFNNSVNMSGSGSNTRVIDLSQSGPSVIQNNIFANSAGGTAVFMQNWSNPGTLDYNCLYSSGEFLATKGSAYKTLAEWTASTTYDAHSFSLNPAFVSESDLHTSAVLLNGNATPVDLVTIDIDGESRDAVNPDIGADEFLTPTFSLGQDLVICVDHTITIDAGIGFESYLWSTGSDSSSTVIDSTGIGFGEKEVSVTVNLDGTTYYDTIKVGFSSPVAVPVPDYCFNDNVDSIMISAGDGVLYDWVHGPTTQSVYITGGGWYMVTVTDENGCTDQGEITIHYSFCSANLNMPRDTTITYSEPIILDANSSCEANYDYYSFLWNTGDTTETITLDILQVGTGTHTFIVHIIDKVNLCESSDTVNVTLEYSMGINEFDGDNQIVIFPNPTTGMFHVQGEKIEKIEVYDVQGQILQIVKGKRMNMINLGHQPKGIYFVKVIQGESYQVKKLILE